MRTGRCGLFLHFAVTVLAVSLSAAVAWGVPRSLSVQSSPINGISITGSPAGTTNYSTDLSEDTYVSLTAPATVDPNYGFDCWMINGGSWGASQTTVSFCIDSYTTAVALYQVIQETVLPVVPTTCPPAAATMCPEISTACPPTFTLCPAVETQCPSCGFASLLFGMRNGATNLWDEGIDTVAPPPSPDGDIAYLSTIAGETACREKLWGDYRAPATEGDSTIWRLFMYASAGKTLTVSWDQASLPAGKTCIIRTATTEWAGTGATFDMRTDLSSVTVTGDGGAAWYLIAVSGGAEIEWSVNLRVDLAIWPVLAVESSPMTGVAITGSTGMTGTTNYRKRIDPTELPKTVALTAPATGPAGSGSPPFVHWTVNDANQGDGVTAISFSVTAATTAVAVYEGQPTINPVVPTACPAVTTECPAVATACSSGATQCPPINTICPPATTQCPVAETTCPPAATVCPADETVCPPLETQCPPAPTLCWPVETQCPAVTTVCPPCVFVELVLGMENGTTNGFDEYIDQPAAPPNQDGETVYFSTIADEVPPRDKLRTDYRAPATEGASTDWRLFMNAAEGKTLTVSWDQASLPEDKTCAIRAATAEWTGTGGTFDMSTGLSSVSVGGDAGAARYLISITGGSADEWSLTLVATLSQWSVLSVQSTPPETAGLEILSTTFPGFTNYTVPVNPASPTVDLTAPDPEPVSGNNCPFAHWIVNDAVQEAGQTAIAFDVTAYTTAVAVYEPPAPTVRPIVATECPPVATTCPPNSPTVCPETPTECPVEATICPPAATSCPPVDTTCPPVTTQCPVAATTCPPVPTACPPIETECPAAATECPAEATACPPGATYCPPADTTCPPVTTICPPVATQCPVASVSLIVRSTPITGVAMAGTPAGTTNYTAAVSICPGTHVRLTAPLLIVRSGRSYWFVRWMVNGVGQAIGNRAVVFDINADTTAIATYKYVRYLKIIGPTRVIGGTTVKYACRAYYSIGSSSLVTYKASWYDNSRYVSFLSAAKLKTYSVRSKVSCRITAKYGGVSGYCNIYIVPR